VVDGALAELADRSLLTLSLDGQTVIVHCLIMRVMQDVLARRARIAAVCRDAASVLHRRAKALARSPDQAAVMDFTEQVAALQQTAAGAAAEADGDLDRMMLRLRSWALYLLIAAGGRADQAIGVGEPLTADLALMLGAGHPDRWPRATTWLSPTPRRAAPLRRRRCSSGRWPAGSGCWGPDHPDTLASRDNLGHAYQEAGRAGEAIALFEQTLATSTLTLGPDHPRTLISRAIWPAPTGKQACERACGASGSGEPGRAAQRRKRRARPAAHRRTRRRRAARRSRGPPAP
jgi:Tetratricopeptide repeat